MQEMINEVDLDGDGKIKFDDFVACLVCGMDVVPHEVRLETNNEFCSTPILISTSALASARIALHRGQTRLCVLAF